MSLCQYHIPLIKHSQPLNNLKLNHECYPGVSNALSSIYTRAQYVIAACKISSFPAVVDQVAGPLEIWDSCARNSGDIVHARNTGVMTSILRIVEK